MTRRPTSSGLSRRERQLMDTVYRFGEPTAAEIHAALPDPPSYSAVRALLVVLEEKGLLTHRRDGRSYRYRPTVSRQSASRSALRHVVRTFFDNSVGQVVSTLFDLTDTSLSESDLARLEELVRARRRKEKGKIR